MSWLPEELRLSTTDIQDRLLLDKHNRLYTRFLPSMRQFYRESHWLQADVQRMKQEPWRYEQPLAVRVPAGVYLVSDLEKDDE